MLAKLWSKFFGVEGAALACSKPCYIWSVYIVDGQWWFSWHNEAHTRGETRGPFVNEVDAVWSKQRWASAHVCDILVEQGGN